MVWCGVHRRNHLAHQCTCKLCCHYVFIDCLAESQGTTDFLKGMGLGMIADQLASLKLGELLDTPPPGLDEAVAIAKVSVLSSGTGPVSVH